MLRASGTARDGEGGFTLLEVVVAFVILGLTLGAALNLFSTGAGQSRVAARQAAALVHANALLATLDATGLPPQGESEGRFDDGYRWRLVVTPLDATGLVGGNAALRPFAVDATVAWGENGAARSVSLSSVRLKEPRT